ncbi:MAG: tail fiber domain-containing protein [Akkermansiaceae bacterium]|nr:tail fiber domain-containing protein [Akkermansiaceae bacterium]
MNKIFLILAATALALLPQALQAAVPQVLNHQGRLAVNGVNFEGSGQFKFALVNQTGNVTHWSNDGTGGSGAEPTAAVTLAVSKGLYAVLLGDVSVPNMTAVPTSVFENADVRLRVWFDDGSNGFQLMTPDQRLVASPYALTADKANSATSAAAFTGSLIGEVTGTQGATAISAATVTGKALTGYVSEAGDITASDTILSAINKLNGNNALKANAASPTFTGNVSGITATMVGLGNVSNTSDASKPVSEAQQTALDLKANLASPTFTGNVSGITATMVGLENVSNTSDASKPVSDAQQTALNLKANLASPTFTGTVQLPAGSSSAAPLRLATGTNLTTAVLGSVEFDGTNLYLTTNATSPTRKIVALSDPGSSAQIALTSVVAAAAKPVVAWGRNTNAQTSVPTLANVSAVAAGSAHSLALLNAGTVVAWGLNTSGQTTVPSTLSGVTEIAAGATHNLARKSDGTLVAWGSNTYGQTTIPSGITTAVKVAAGEKHSLALLANGTVRAWGDNFFGQTTIPSALSGVTVTAIAAGYEHSLALTAGGTVVAWGRSDADQINVPGNLTGVVAIAAGAYHSLALKSDGKVVAWGWNNSGQVSATATWSDVVKIAGGYGCSLASMADGTLAVGGDNSYLQKILPADATQVTAIAAGANHFLALRSSLLPVQLARLDQDNVFTGKVGIQRTPATNELEVAGDASKSTAGSWLSNSDRRIKTEIQSIGGALEKLEKIRLVDFRYTDNYLAAHPEIEDRRYPNVIAQEFAQVFPNDVKSSGEKLADGSEILQVDTYPLTIYAAAAVQELHRDNQKLHRENQVLKRQVSDQEQRLRKLEAILAK